MTVLRIALLFAAGVPCFVLAQSTGRYQCTQGDMVRRVEIYTEPGQAAPCEVHYFKDTEAPGEPEVLWRAQTDAAFCESRTAEFISQLESWGWTCDATAAQPAAPRSDEPPPEPVVEDDTDVLSPGGS